MPSLTGIVPYPTDPPFARLASLAPAVKLYLGDVVAPTFALVSPAAGSTLPAGSTPIVFDVKDELALERVSGVFVAFSDANEEVAWDGVALAAAYSAGSSMTAVAGGYRFSLVRAGGWKSNPTVYASARDSAGNRLSLGSASFVYAYPYDATAPARAIVTPSVGSTLPASSTPLVVDVTDAGTLKRVLLLVAFSDSTEEVAWDGYAFAAGYSGSTVSNVSGGKRFSLVRTAGWRSAPTLFVNAEDTAGNELVLASSAFAFAAEPLTEVNPPSVTVVSPAAGSTITVATPLVVDVVDAEGHLQTTVVSISFDDSTEAEVAHNGSIFSSRYLGSTRTAIANGFRYSLVRVGGWRASPRLHVYAFDSKGNQAGS